MAVYALVELEIGNLEEMNPYVERVHSTIEAHGGRYLVRGGRAQVQEGGLGDYPTKVIVEFPSMQAAKTWYDSDEYQAILPYRTANSTGNFVWLEGV